MVCEYGSDHLVPRYYKQMASLNYGITTILVHGTQFILLLKVKTSWRIISQIETLPHAGLAHPEKLKGIIID